MTDKAFSTAFELAEDGAVAQAESASVEPSSLMANNTRKRRAEYEIQEGDIFRRPRMKTRAEQWSDLASDVQYVEPDRTYGTSAFHHKLRSHYPRNPGIRDSSNQIITEQDFEKREIHRYIQYFRYGCKMMGELRHLRRVLPEGATVKDWKDHHAIPVGEQLSSWLEPIIRGFYAGQTLRLHTIHRALDTWWVTEEDYQQYVTAHILPSSEEDEDNSVAPLFPPATTTLLTFSSYRTNVSYLREWNNFMLERIKDKDRVPKSILLVVCKLFSKPIEPKRADLFLQFQELYYKKYNCLLVMFPCHHLTFDLTHWRLMPEYIKLDPLKLPPPIEKIKNKHFRELFTNDPTAMLRAWSPGDLICSKSYIESTQPILDYMRLVYKEDELYGIPKFVAAPAEDEGEL